MGRCYVGVSHEESLGSSVVVSCVLVCVDVCIINRALCAARHDHDWATCWLGVSSRVSGTDGVVTSSGVSFCGVC